MTYCEVDCFVTKFKYLCQAGFVVTLIVEVVDGKASVTLKSVLGPITPPYHVPRHGQPRGPSYQRRQERRQAAREAAAAGQVGDQPPPGDTSVAEEANDVLSGTKKQAEQAGTVANASVEDIIEKAEQAGEVFPCLICDFVSNWVNGLQVHMTRKHSNIEQIDGNSENEDFDDEKYLGTERYWKTGKLGTIFQDFLDTNFIIEKSDLSKEDKANEHAKILEARKSAFGIHFKDYPPWK